MANTYQPTENLLPINRDPCNPKTEIAIWIKKHTLCWKKNTPEAYERKKQNK